MSNATGLPIVAALALLAVPACTRSLHDGPVGYAQTVTDWDGFTNLFRDGKLYFAGQPDADALGTAPDRGVKAVVNLRTPDEMTHRVGFDEEALVRELGMEYVSLPVTSASFSVSDADRLKELLSRTPGPVLIHCAGSNRVGALWALYLHRHRGFELDEAIKRGKRAGLRSASMIDAVTRIAAQTPSLGE